jgi:hypothetical protein
VVRGIVVTLSACVVLGVIAAAVNLSATATDVLAVAAVPVVVPLALGVSPLRLLRRR